MARNDFLHTDELINGSLNTSNDILITHCGVDGESNNGSNSSFGTNLPAPKKTRILQCYRVQYQQMPEFKEWITSSSKGKHYAQCKLCSCDLKISQRDLMKHSDMLAM